MSESSNPVNWFEIPVNDLARAKSFYEALCGVQLSEQEMGSHQMAWFPMQPDGAGANGTLIQGEGYQPSHVGTLGYLHVADIDSALATVNENGGRTLLPKTGIGEHGSIAHFEDTEGNRVALHENPSER